LEEQFVSLSLAFIIKQTIEKRREFNLETHIAFLDLEKAFYRVNRNELWQIINKRDIPYHLIEVIKSLYKNTRCTNRHKKENS